VRIGFDDFVLDSGKRELTRKGDAVHLSPKAFRLLELLLAATPAAVRRADLYAQLWGNVFVEEANLPNLISEIRTALGDTAKTPRHIKTLHRFGYRFAAETSTARSPSPHRFFVHWASTEFPLSEGANIVGRDETAHVRVESAGVSRRHAVLTISGDDVVIQDQGSKNGTFVHGKRIDAPVPLRSGDTIRLGSASLTLHCRAEAESTMTELSSDHP
jgi:DNA-binding winged helix-turn-helix (wHTH) protein